MTWTSTPVTTEKVGDSESIVVDTRQLICAKNRSTGGTPQPCVKALEPQ
jgi:hypothetical protein